MTNEKLIRSDRLKRLPINGQLRGASFSPDGKHIYGWSIDRDQRINHWYIWDVENLNRQQCSSEFKTVSLALFIPKIQIQLLNVSSTQMPTVATHSSLYQRTLPSLSGPIEYQSLEEIQHDLKQNH